MENQEQVASHKLLTQVGCWFLEKKKFLFYGFFLFLTGFLLIHRYFPFFQKEEKFLSAQKSYQRWKESSGEENAWKKMQEDWKKNGFLRDQYGPEIVQECLCQGKAGRVHDFVQELFKRVGDQLGPYHSFSETSCLVMEGKLTLALQGAKTLKKQLDEDLSFSKNSLLYGHNLLRILFLERALHNTAEENLAAKQLEEYLQKNKDLFSNQEGLFSKSDRKYKEIGLAAFLLEKKSSKN